MIAPKSARVPHFFGKTGAAYLDLNQIARWRIAQF
jgi:hypothetical protein